MILGDEILEFLVWQDDQFELFLLEIQPMYNTGEEKIKKNPLWLEPATFLLSPGWVTRCSYQLRHRATLSEELKIYFIPRSLARSVVDDKRRSVYSKFGQKRCMYYQVKVKSDVICWKLALNLKNIGGRVRGINYELFVPYFMLNFSSKSLHVVVVEKCTFFESACELLQSSYIWVIVLLCLLISYSEIRRIWSKLDWF